MRQNRKSLLAFSIRDNAFFSVAYESDESLASRSLDLWKAECARKAADWRHPRSSSVGPSRMSKTLQFFAKAFPLGEAKGRSRAKDHD